MIPGSQAEPYDNKILSWKYYKSKVMSIKTLIIYALVNKYNLKKSISA